MYLPYNTIAMESRRRFTPMHGAQLWSVQGMHQMPAIRQKCIVENEIRMGIS
jgi:hypothetical protein